MNPTSQRIASYPRTTARDSSQRTWAIVEKSFTTQLVRH
jgi:hypothetical protein